MPRSKPNRFRPSLHALEDRAIPSVLGTASTDITATEDTAYAVGVQADGRILAVGASGVTSADGPGAFALTRYNSDLTLDTTFGSNGVRTTAISNQPSAARAMAIQPADGKTVAAGWVQTGTSTTGDDFAVARYTTAGALDTTFGGTGYVTTNVSGSAQGTRYDRAQAVAIDANGRIVAAGMAFEGTNQRFAVARYNANGTLDTSFNSAGPMPGTVQTRMLGNSESFATAVLIQPDGKIVVGGQYRRTGFSVLTAQFGLVRYNANGTLDTTFGSGGVAVLPKMGNQSNPGNKLNSLAFDASGNIVAVGSGYPSGNQSRFLIARVQPNGAVDTTFGGGTGFVYLDVNPGSSSSASSVKIQADGKIVVGGTGGSNAYMDVARFNADGSLNPTFNTTGYLTMQLGGQVSAACGLALDDAGNAILAGEIDGAFGVAVVNADAGPSTGASINDVSITEGHAGTTLATFTVSLDQPAAESVSVNFTTANATATAGSDYQSASGTVTFAPGETSQTISIAVTGDRLGEPEETFVVLLTQPVGISIVDGSGTGTILDDEPRISIGDVSLIEGKKGQTTQFIFTVSLSNAYDQPVTVSFRTLNGTATTSNGDYVAKTGTLTFAPGETTKTIVIDVKGDNTRESNETFWVELFGGSTNAMLLDSLGLGTIVNDD